MTLLFFNGPIIAIPGGEIYSLSSRKVASAPGETLLKKGIATSAAGVATLYYSRIAPVTAWAASVSFRGIFVYRATHF